MGYLLSAINILLAIRFSSILSMCANHRNTIWSTLLANSLFISVLLICSLITLDLCHSYQTLQALDLDHLYFFSQINLTTNSSWMLGWLRPPTFYRSAAALLFFPTNVYVTTLNDQSHSWKHLSVWLETYTWLSLVPGQRALYNTIAIVIIIYHDFLPTPRRGSHVKSGKTHTQSSRYTP